MECYSVLKRDELSSHEKTWRDPKCITLHERRQSGKGRHYMIPTISHSENGKTVKAAKRLVVTRGWGWGQG